MFWGNFVMSLVIVSLANLVDLNRKEAQVYF
jgi:protein tyrosine phosphatase